MHKTGACVPATNKIFKEHAVYSTNRILGELKTLQPASNLTCLGFCSSMRFANRGSAAKIYTRAKPQATEPASRLKTLIF